MKGVINKIAVIVAVLTLVACGATAQLSKGGSLVRIVKKEPLQCIELGKFFGKGARRNYALNDIKNQIAARGGNRLYIFQISEYRGKGGTFVFGNDHYFEGYGFKCN